MLTNAQYALISPTPFVYLTHLGPITIQDGTTAHANSNMQIAHTDKVRMFREVTGVKQSLVKKNCCHSRRRIPCKYQQPDGKFNQQYRGGHVDLPPKQLRSVYTP